jgi:hypothetical protein
MSQIDFGDTTADHLATLMSLMRTVHRDLYGNGQEGIKSKAERFMSEAEGARKEQDRQHQQNTTKLNWILALCAIATALIGALGCVYTIEAAKHSENDPAKIFHSQQSRDQSQSAPLDSRNPVGYISH